MSRSSEDLQIIGSTSLVDVLHRAGLIDRYTLLITPLTLGTGARLFEHPASRAEFELMRSIVTTKGVIIAEYERH
jgi:dihydrofolate reductase